MVVGYEGVIDEAGIIASETRLEILIGLAGEYRLRQRLDALRKRRNDIRSDIP